MRVVAFPHEASFSVSQWLEEMIGPAFRHAVGNGVGEAYLFEEAFHVGVERCAADDDFIEIAAEDIHSLFAHVRFYLSLTIGIRSSSLPILLSMKWQDVFLDNLLYDERHAGYDARLDFGE